MVNDPNGELLPPLTQIGELSRKIAFAVAKTAIEQELALGMPDALLEQKIESNFWRAEYRPYKRVSL
jgi:malate dehydrogenase (oxaloacetate-decarboxylating)